MNQTLSVRNASLSRRWPARAALICIAAAAALLLTACNPTQSASSTNIRGFYEGGDGGHWYTPTASGVVQVDVTNSSCTAVLALVSVNSPNANPFGYPEFWGADDNVPRGFTNITYAVAGQPFVFYMYHSDPGSTCWADFKVRVINPNTGGLIGDLN